MRNYEVVARVDMSQFNTTFTNATGNVYIFNQQIRNANAELNCAFGELFTQHADNIIMYEYRTGGIGAILDKIKRRLFPYKYVFINDEESQAKFLSEFKSAPDKDYFIRSYSNFYDAHDYDFIKPTALIDNSVTALLGGAKTENLVGVQIRRTDNAISIANSPTELFIEYMQKELKANPQTVFYLATDDMNVNNEISARFGSHLVCRRTEPTKRNTKSGMIDAATDFIALSRCRRIYGSYWSSFCEVANDIGKNELIVVKK